MAEQFAERYPSLSRLGLSSELLLAVAVDSDSDSVTEDVRFPKSIVTNRNMLELHDFLDRNSSCSYYTYWRWASSLLRSSRSKNEFPTINSLRQSILRLSSKLAKLKKLPSSDEKLLKLAEFFEHEYELPNVFVARGRRVVVSTSSDESSCSSCADLRDLVQKSRKKMYDVHRNEQKKLKRRDAKILDQSAQLLDKKQTIRDLQKCTKKADDKVQDVQAKLDRLMHRVGYWKKKCMEARVYTDEDAAISEASHKEQLLQDEIRLLETDNIELREKVQGILSDASDKICTFEGGRYTDDVRTCCYELLSLNVGVSNVKRVIKSVLRNIAHKEADRLPEKTALCDMLIECLTCAQAQLGEELSQQDGAHYTLQSDGTTKHGQHFATFDVATSDTTFALGLRHVFSGSAQSTLDTLLEILEDLDCVQKELGKASVSSTIVAKLKNTMSDRHAAEKLFATVLSDYRANILPDIVTGWEQMSSAEQEQLMRMNNFFCGLHFLVGLAEAAEETLKVWESTTEGEEVVSSSKSSRTQNLIRTACKSFHHRGSEQAGCSTHFRTHLRHKGIEKLPLASFIGNRFNILFYDAAGVFYLKSYMLDYLQNYHGSRNRLLQSVFEDLKSPFLITGCRVLGIIDKVVTGPFWRYLQTSSVSILQMSEVYTRMRDTFQKWSEDAQPVLESQVSLFPSTTSFHDDIMECLFKPTEDDDSSLELLQLLFKSFVLTIERLLTDHLPGGVFHNVDDPAIISETLSVPKTNVVPERDFAILDRMLQQKPNARHIALESLILFSQNKTSDWLQSKSPVEIERLLQASRKLTKIHRENFKKRKEEIQAKRLEMLQQKALVMSKKRERDLKEKEKLTLKIQKYSLWITKTEVEQKISELKTKKAQVEALKAQISFRKKVLCQENVDNCLFKFSHDRRCLSVEELTDNLCKLLLPPELPEIPDYTKIAEDPELLLYRRINHKFIYEGTDTWYKGTVMSYDEANGTFRVAYDNEDEIFSFPLLEDIQNGDLLIL